MAQEGTNLIPEQSALPSFEDLLHTQPCEEVAATLSLIGDKWTVLVIAFLANGPRRFNELKRLIGSITQRMLTLTLRQLERDGLVSRRAFPTIPPRVEYELTELGRSLHGPILALAIWVISNQTALKAARKTFDARP